MRIIGKTDVETIREILSELDSSGCPINPVISYNPKNKRLTLESGLDPVNEGELRTDAENLQTYFSEVDYKVDDEEDIDGMIEFLFSEQ